MEGKRIYRTEYYSGSGIRDLAVIIEYEMSELRNTDIPRYILGHYDLPEELRKEIEDTLSLEDEGEYPFLFDRHMLNELINSMIRAVSRQTGMKLRYGLWLASRETVEQHYGAGEQIDAYPVGDAVLSDLGPDGILYAYQTNPKPIQK